MKLWVPLIALALALVAVSGDASVETVPDIPLEDVRGDQNCDHVADAQDAVMVLGHAARLRKIVQASCIGYADTVCDGVIDVQDALADLLNDLSIQTLPAEPCTPVLIGAGDIAHCSSPGDEQTSELLETMPGTLFTLGDNVYETGTAEEWANCYGPSWGGQKARTRPVSGNHDYYANNGAAYYAYFGALAGDPTKGYYSYDLGTWHIIVLNSECQLFGGCQADSAQGLWLQEDLDATSADCVIAMWHKPVVTVGPHAGDEGGILPLWQMLWDEGVDLVLSGHDHNYQRYGTLNRNANAADPNGMREIVVGTGGRGLTDIDPAYVPIAPDLQVWGDQPDADGHDVSFGVIRLTLYDGSYDWEFVPVTGGTFTDSGTANCR